MLSWHLVKHTFKRVLEERERGRIVRAGVTTNGTPWNVERVKYFAENDFGALVSFDGVPFVQNYMRPMWNGRESYPLVARTINLMRVYHLLNLRCAMAVSPEAIPYLVDSVKEAVKIGFESIAFNKVVDSYRTYTINDFKELERQYRKAAYWAKENDISIVFVDKTITRLQKKMPRHTRSRWTCGACQGSTAVGLDGFIYPCHRLIQPEFRIGHVETGVDKNKVEFWRGLDHEQCYNCLVYPCGGCYKVCHLRSGGKSLTEIPEDYCTFEQIRYQISKEVMRIG